MEVASLVWDYPYCCCLQKLVQSFLFYFVCVHACTCAHVVLESLVYARQVHNHQAIPFPIWISLMTAHSASECPLSWRKDCLEWSWVQGKLLYQQQGRFGTQARFWHFSWRKYQLKPLFTFWNGTSPGGGEGARDLISWAKKALS